MIAASQILAILQNEFRMQWRRKGLLVLTLGMAALPIATAFFIRSQLATISQEWVASGAMTAAEARRQLAQTILPIIWSPLYVVLALILPILTADAVARDRQISSASGWGELLDSLPLPGSVYLAGKLLGVWASTLASCLAAALLTGVTWWLVVGPFDLGLYLQEWLFGAAALALLNGGLSAILAAAQPSPRRAVAVGVAVAVASLTWLALSPILRNKAPVSFWDYTNISRPVLFLYFFQSARSIGSTRIGSAVNGSDVLWTILVGLLEIALVGLAMWAWIYRPHFKKETIQQDIQDQQDAD